MSTWFGEYDWGEVAPGLCTGAQPQDAGDVERRILSVDFGGLPPALLEEGARAVATELDAGERVYLHCRAGWQRSATVAAAVLVVRHGARPATALREIRARRPVARPLEHQVADLVHWARTR